jgi:hypothetical protein
MLLDWSQRLHRGLDKRHLVILTVPDLRQEP